MNEDVDSIAAVLKSKLMKNVMVDACSPPAEGHIPGGPSGIFEDAKKTREAQISWSQKVRRRATALDMRKG